MFGKRTLLILSVASTMCLPLIARAQGSEQAKYVANPDRDDYLSITIHRNDGCDGPALDATKSAAFTTGETLYVCFEPSFPAYIYIINESADGTYIAYPDSSDRLGPVSARQSYAFELVGRPGLETLTFFVSKAPVEHLEEFVRRGRLKLSNGKLFTGDGSETARSGAGYETAAGAVKGGAPVAEGARVTPNEFMRQSSPLYRPVPPEWLDAFFERLFVRSPVPSDETLALEQARFDADRSNTLNARPKASVDNSARIPEGKTLILQLAYEHRNP